MIVHERAKVLLIRARFAIILSQIAIVFSLLVSLGIGAAQAEFVYQYTGNNYENFYPSSGNSYDISMSIVGSFTTGSPLINFKGDANLDVMQYSFFDGLNTLTEADSKVTMFYLETNGSGNIMNWFIRLDNFEDIVNIGDRAYLIETVSDEIIQLDRGSIVECIEVGCSTVTSIASAWSENPGNWSVVPVSSALWLFGSGLLGLIGIGRRKKAA